MKPLVLIALLTASASLGYHLANGSINEASSLKPISKIHQVTKQTSVTARTATKRSPAIVGPDSEISDIDSVLNVEGPIAAHRLALIQGIQDEDFERVCRKWLSSMADSSATVQTIFCERLAQHPEYLKDPIFSRQFLKAVSSSELSESSRNLLRSLHGSQASQPMSPADKLIWLQGLTQLNPAGPRMDEGGAITEYLVNSASPEECGEMLLELNRMTDSLQIELYDDTISLLLSKLESSMIESNRKAAQNLRNALDLPAPK